MSVCSWWHPVVWILLLYPMDLLHHLEKGNEELSPLQYHIKSLHIISRHYKKSLLRSQIYHGYEELSTDTNTLYEEDKKEEASMRCSLLHGSWDQILQRCLSHLFRHVPIIVSSWNFQESLPWSEVMSMQKVKVRGQRSRSQRSTPNLAISGL